MGGNSIFQVRFSRKLYGIRVHITMRPPEWPPMNHISIIIRFYALIIQKFTNTFTNAPDDDFLALTLFVPYGNAEF